jgi:hypothetical protein
MIHLRPPLSGKGDKRAIIGRLDSQEATMGKRPQRLMSGSRYVVLSAETVGAANAMSAALQSPRGFKTAGTSSGMTLSEELEAAKYRATKSAFDDANDAIEAHAPVEERKARMVAMRTFIIDEVDQPQMHGTLRTALNGLVKHFGLEGRRAA